MPFIQIKVIEGVFSPDRKRELIKKITDAWVSLEREQERDYTWIVIDEVKSGDWGIAGKPVTIEDVHSLGTGLS